MKTILIASSAVVTAIIAAFSFSESGQPTPIKLDLNKPLVVVQFNASFNEANTYKGLETLKVPYQYVEVDNQPMLKTQHKIKSIPTVIIFRQGKEVKRWEGDVMLKLSIPLNTIKLEAK
jgi:hypothetical protein